MDFGSYCQFDALGLAELVAKKEIGPEEPLKAAIARAEEINPVLNAITQKNYDQALADLAKVDQGAPLRGVPFLLKDTALSLAGTETSIGSRFLEET
jgi:amidase